MSSANSVLNSLPTFDGSNYRRWADRMKPYLQMYNLWGVVAGDEEDPDDLEAGEGVTLLQLEVNISFSFSFSFIFISFKVSL
jgi:hypothetical protein